MSGGESALLFQHPSRKVLRRPLRRFLLTLCESVAEGRPFTCLITTDQALQDSLSRVLESAARRLADQFHDELAGLVTGTIERWDASETSTQLELLLGRDLQFIRINGTVVGAGVGLALHAIALALA